MNDHRQQLRRQIQITISLRMSNVLSRIDTVHRNIVTLTLTLGHGQFL
jgi:hypothetical protein